MTYRDRAGSSLDAEGEVLRELAARLGALRLRWLVPIALTAALAGGLGTGAQMFGNWLPVSSIDSRTLGAAAATAFLIPFGAVAVPGVLLYRRRVALEKGRWLTELQERPDIDADAMEEQARIFR